MNRGFTVVELVLAIVVSGVVLLVLAPRFGAWTDRWHTDRAALEIASFYQRGRFAAVFRGTRVRLEFSEDSLKGVFEGAVDSTFVRLEGPARHGVRLEVSRPVIRIHPNGIGWGAANTKLVLRRGAAAESLTTSRLGRLKRWR